MTPTRRNDPAYTVSTNHPAEDEQTGGRRQNRKRTRHRPRSRGRRAGGPDLTPTPIQPQPPSGLATRSSGAATAPTAMSINYSYACPLPPPARRPGAATTPPHTPRLDHKQHWRWPEDACARERRIFGSCEGGSGGDQLKMGMLDVVLGLFDGLDYDDEGLC